MELKRKKFQELIFHVLNKIKFGISIIGHEENGEEAIDLIGINLTILLRFLDTVVAHLSYQSQDSIEINIEFLVILISIKSMPVDSINHLRDKRVH